MVQWFSPGFLDCTQRFETRITSGILLWILAWAGGARFVLCCSQVRFCPWPESCCLCLRLDVERQFEIIRYTVFSIVCENRSIPTKDTCYRRRSWSQARAWTDLPQILLIHKEKRVAVFRIHQGTETHKASTENGELLHKRIAQLQIWTAPSSIRQYQIVANNLPMSIKPVMWGPHTVQIHEGSTTEVHGDVDT